MRNDKPRLPSTVGKRGRSKMPPGGKIIRFVVVDEVRAYQDRARDKMILLQLVSLDSGKFEVRVGYYIIGKLPKMRGKWVWGQYAPFTPASVFRRLVGAAEVRGWFSAPARLRRLAAVHA